APLALPCAPLGATRPRARPRRRPRRPRRGWRRPCVSLALGVVFGRRRAETHPVSSDPCPCQAPLEISERHQSLGGLSRRSTVEQRSTPRLRRRTVSVGHVR